MGNTSWSGTRTSFTPTQRASILGRDPECRCDGWCHLHDGPCDQRSTEADHVTPVAEGGEHDPDGNGQGLCSDCHTVKTRAEQARGRIRHGKKRPPETSKHPGLR